jgi:hypothetical protein
VANPHLDQINWQALHRRLTGMVQNGKENQDKRILTDKEEDDLVKYLIDSNLMRDGKDMCEIGIKVRIRGVCRGLFCSFGCNEDPYSAPHQ